MNRIIVTTILGVLMALASWIVLAARVDLWQPYEPDLVQAAREMWERGDWLTPYLNDLTYYEKPPLYYWSALIVAKLAGSFSEWTARVPSIVSGGVLLAATYALGRLLLPPPVGWLAVAMYVSTPVLIYCSTKGMTDALLAAAVMTSLVAFVRAFWGDLARGAQRRAFLVGWLSLAIGFLAKGPVAVAFTLLSLLPEVICSRQLKKLLHGANLLGALLFVALVAPWYVYGMIVNGEPFLRGALLEQNIGRFFELEPGGGPFFYLMNVPSQLGIWTVLLPALLWFAWRDRARWLMPGFNSLRFLWSGVLAQFVFLSAANGKIPKYLLPTIALICLLLAETVHRLAPRRAASSTWLLRVPLAFAALALIAALGLPTLVEANHIAVDRGVVWVIASLIAVGGACSLWVVLRHAHLTVPVISLVTSGALLAITTSPVLMQINAIKSSREFAERAKQTMAPDVPLFGYRVSACESLFLYYSGRSYRLMPSIEALVAARHEQGHLFVLTRPAFFADLPVAERAHFRLVLKQEDDKREYLLVEATP